MEPTEKKHHKKSVLYTIVTWFSVALGVLGCSGDDENPNPSPVVAAPQTDMGIAPRVGFRHTAGLFDIAIDLTNQLLSGATGPAGEPLSFPPPQTTIPCDFGTGPINIAHVDNDANLNVSAGDQIQFTATNCTLDNDDNPATVNDQETSSGTVTLTINNVSGNPPALPWGISSSASFTDLQVTTSMQTAAISGGFDLNTSSDAAGFHLIQTGGPVTVTTNEGDCTVNPINIRADRNTANQYNVSLESDLSCSRSDLQGMLTVRTPVPLSGAAGSDPSAGQMIITAPDNSSTRLTPQPDAVHVAVELDTNGDGVYDSAVSPVPTWGDLFPLPFHRLNPPGTTPPAPITPTTLLPDTWQTTCYGPGMAVIDCAGSGQDGAYTIHQMSFTDNGNGTVTDNVTGFMWQKEDDDVLRAGGAAYCEDLQLAGYSDWVVPSKRQMLTIVHYGHLHRAISDLHFPGTNIGADGDPGGHNDTFYWTSTPMARDPSSWWSVNFHEGAIFGKSNTLTGLMRCVRNATDPAPAFVDNGNETVTDTTRNLMWQKQTNLAASWDSALMQCEGLTLGAYSDWRLANVKELESIVDPNSFDPAINTIFFPGTQAAPYWSSTTAIHRLNNAWVVSFGDGNVLQSVDKSTPTVFSCVRNAQ